jgi:hypothetical protein
MLERFFVKQGKNADKDWFLSSIVIAPPTKPCVLARRIFVVRWRGKAAGMLAPFKALLCRLAAKGHVIRCKVWLGAQ